MPLKRQGERSGGLETLEKLNLPLPTKQLSLLVELSKQWVMYLHSNLVDFNEPKMDCRVPSMYTTVLAFLTLHIVLRLPTKSTTVHKVHHCLQLSTKTGFLTITVALRVHNSPSLANFPNNKHNCKCGGLYRSLHCPPNGLPMIYITLLNAINNLRAPSNFMCGLYGMHIIPVFLASSGSVSRQKLQEPAVCV